MTDNSPMEDDGIALQGMVAAEIDRRKLEKAINTGKISREELANAPVVHISDPNATPFELDKPEYTGKIVQVNCGMCEFHCKTMERYQKHLAEDHGIGEK